MTSTSTNVRQYDIPAVSTLNGIVRRIAETTAWFNVLLILIILMQVVMRYGFKQGLVPLEELMWHLYAVAFMFGMAYSITNDSHIRVDIVHMSLPRGAQHLLEILGILFLLMPFLVILFDHSIGWVAESYRIGESSANPTGLPYRWLIKAVVPLSALLMFIAALARLIQEVLLLLHLRKEPPAEISGRVTMMRKFFHLKPVDDGTDPEDNEEKR
jgi:TRAP-type mannitol/chloroaromatic compound transport system permease small subunit